jgi:hypothetical protein
MSQRGLQDRMGRVIDALREEGIWSQPSSRGVAGSGRLQDVNAVVVHGRGRSGAQGRKLRPVICVRASPPLLAGGGRTT